MTSDKSAIVISFHLWNSKRKAGFHKIAESLIRHGYNVTFVTGSASYLSLLKSDYRTPLIKDSAKNEIIKITEQLSTFLMFNLAHPVNMRSRLLNSISKKYFAGYKDFPKKFKGLNQRISKAELIIFESFPGLLWFEYFKEINPNAKIVYRVSDDIQFQNQHPLIVEHEKKNFKDFNLVSVPSKYIYDKFYPSNNLKLHYHGIDKVAFDSRTDNPYSTANNCIFTGNSYFDTGFLKIASDNFPDLNFHIIGNISKDVNSKNVFYYGEIPFENTIPFVKFADIGLHNLTYSKGVESFSDSLKVIQYSYCNLPIIVPDFIKSDRENFIYYILNDSTSIVQAVNCAREFNKTEFSPKSILTWDELTSKLINE